MKKNWRTTTIGIAVIVAAVAKIIADPNDSAHQVTEILAGIGLLLAKDSSGTQH